MVTGFFLKLALIVMGEDIQRHQYECMCQEYKFQQAMLFQYFSLLGTAGWMPSQLFGALVTISLN